MTPPVSTNRWRGAQAAERSYWQALGGDSVEVARVLTEKVNIAAWIERNLPAGLPGLPGGPWAEIEIGPLDVGCTHFLRVKDAQEFVGAAGFRVIASNRPNRPRLSQIAGHAHRLLLLAEKPASASAAGAVEL